MLERTLCQRISKRARRSRRSGRPRGVDAERTQNLRTLSREGRAPEDPRYGQPGVSLWARDVALASAISSNAGRRVAGGRKPHRTANRASRRRPVKKNGLVIDRARFYDARRLQRDGIFEQVTHGSCVSECRASRRCCLGENRRCLAASRPGESVVGPLDQP